MSGLSHTGKREACSLMTIPDQAAPARGASNANARVELLALPGLPDFAEGDDLACAILGSAEAGGIGVATGDVMVIAQKVVSKCEGAFVDLDQVSPGQEAQRLAATTAKDPRLVEAILADTSEVLRAKKDVLVVANRAGHVMANAGIDASNVAQGTGERVLRLPDDADASARRLKAEIEAATGTRIAVIINDSWGRAWRNGTVGHAVGAAGLPALWDRRGEKDMHGRTLKVTQIGLADEIAAAASLVMGAAAERQPVVIVRGLSLPDGDGTARDLLRDKSTDLFR